MWTGTSSSPPSPRPASTASPPCASSPGRNEPASPPATTSPRSAATWPNTKNKAIIPERPSVRARGHLRPLALPPRGPGGEPGLQLLPGPAFGDGLGEDLGLGGRSEAADG